MARNMYGATSADFTLTSGGRVIPGAVLTLWTARTGGTRITDLTDLSGTAITSVTSGADGSVVFYGPEGGLPLTLWAESGQGSRIAVRPTNITSLSGPVTTQQESENDVWTLAAALPADGDFAPFEIQGNSFPNAGGGAGTYNHGAWVGFNVGRHSGGVADSGPASFIGLEDNYFDDVGDLLSGQEFYWEVHPDGAAVSPLFRPLYARASVSADGTTVHRAAVIVDIGTSGEGQFTVREGPAGDALFNVTDDAAWAWRPLYVAASVVSVQNDDGGAFLIADGSVSANVNFRIDGDEAFALRAFATQLEVTDDAGTPLITVTSDQTELAGVLAAGTDTAAPTLSTTANLGTSPPTPTVAGNAARGKVSFGSGSGSPAAGAVIGVTLQSGCYDAAPTVVVSAANFATVGRLPFVTVYSATYFEIGLGSAPAVSQSAGTYVVAYQVIG